jgi:hypothetical protein
VLENLSTGGLSLSSVPPGWTEGVPVRFTLEHREVLLPIEGRVAWRHGATVGIAVHEPDDGHESAVFRAVRRILRGDEAIPGAPPPGGATSSR